MVTTVISYFIVSLLVLLFWGFYVKYKQNYWTHHGLRQIYTTFFCGVLYPVIMKKQTLGEMSVAAYKWCKSEKEKHVGIYMFLQPIYFPADLTIIKNILLKDFHYFTNHGIFHHPKDILTMNLFNMEGEAWKQLRIKLTPTFTSGKMKMMYEKLLEKSQDLERIVMEKYATKIEPLNIKDLLARFTTDIIGSCAFGIECNSMEEPNNEFRYYGNAVLVTPPWKIWLIFTLPWSLLGYLGFKMHGGDATDFFTKIVQNTIKYREKSNVIRKDFMHLLLELKNKDSSTSTTDGDADKHTKQQFLTENEIIAQCLIFFLAGFETSSTTMTFALLELAQNEDIQKKLRDNILEVLEKYDGNVTYDAVMEMSYLDKVIHETLRKYPPVPILPRICNKTYHVPGTDGNLIIQKGDRVQIPVWGIHNDPEYYPDPNTFDPERFNEENKSKRPEFSFLPFGEGPRMCIGLRFGMLQTKVGLISLIKKFRFTISKKTKIPVEFDPGKIILSCKNDIWLNVEKI